MSKYSWNRAEDFTGHGMSFLQIWGNIFVNNVKYVTITDNFLFISVFRCCLFFYELFDAGQKSEPRAWYEGHYKN